MKGTSKLQSTSSSSGQSLLFIPNVCQITTTNTAVKKPVVQKCTKKAIKTKPIKIQKLSQITKDIVHQEEDDENFDNQFKVRR